MGDFDRRVIIEKSESSQNEYGEPELIWITHATVWARVDSLSGRELFAAKQVVPEAQLKITIRWRSDMNETMRIIHDGKVYGILHIGEIGRQDRLEILVKLP